MARQHNEERYARESSTGEILQSATTMASIAVAVLVYLLDREPLLVMPLFVSLYLLGGLALNASVISLIELLGEQPGRRWYHLFLPTSSLGFLFYVMLSFGAAYWILFSQLSKLATP